MHAARATKQDEFYTQLSDIEKELKYYAPHFNGKTVLCNCDDPRVSNFLHYFSYNFSKLKLKRLLTTCYKFEQSLYFMSLDLFNSLVRNELVKLCSGLIYKDVSIWA
jgi:thermostable 8-oxoguanine DNA glycosylase